MVRTKQTPIKPPNNFARISPQLQTRSSARKKVKTPQIQTKRYQPKIEGRREIRQESDQASKRQSIKKLPFQRLVCGIAQGMNRKSKMQTAGIAALQEVAEADLVRIFEDSNLCSSSHRKRVTVKPKDMVLICLSADACLRSPKNNEERPSYGTVRQHKLEFHVEAVAYSFFTFRSMWTQPGRHTVENINIEFLLECAWLLQAISSMAFLIYWQREGFIGLIMEQIIIHPSKKGEIPPEEYMKVKRMTRIMMFVCAILVINFTAIVATFVMNHVEDWHKPYMGLHRFDFAYAIISIYGFAVFNLTLIIFVVTVQCVLIQLQNFNRKFRAVLSTSITSTDNRLTLPDRLLELLEMHNKLADKIHLVDSMFRAYTFTSMAFGIPTSVLALIVLIRRRTLLALYYSFNDTACCTFQMLGLTIVPAQIYMEFRSVHNILYRNSALWKNYDARFYQISRTFAKSATQTNAGITLGGFIPITKSLILSSLSLILPYVMLCLQLNVGTNYISSSNVQNIQNEDEPFDKFPVLLWADLLN